MGRSLIRTITPTTSSWSSYNAGYIVQPLTNGSVDMQEPLHQSLFHIADYQITYLIYSAVLSKLASITSRP